ncbi:MFS transporter [Actinoplanes sp. NEAU-A12]|uniref:MFS transporter n=1 Tax=Actinoplanes sandaracinus TaxID=3045177 RepID=A0ABT6WUN0_9ACTN|nr:MFS transporter [Actinoplanes sandaracinus]MDI6103325.1 MFS transporter [Actinoplanes sandaracinus]
MNAPVVKAGRREWLGLIALVLPTLLVSMDISVFFFALPALTEDLAPSGTELLWIMDVYGFLLAGLLVTMGALGDRIGRRKLLLIGAVLFGVASTAAAYADDAAVLILARAAMGIGGATLAPSTLALIRNMFHDEKERTTAIGVWTAGFAGGGVLGPIIGGLLLENFWWGAVFLINIPVMVLLLAVAPILLPEYRNPDPGRFDLLSSVLALASILSIIYGVKEIAGHGAGIGAAAAIVAGLLIGFLFVRRQVGEHAMLDVRLFRNPAFSASLGANTLVMFVMLGTALFMSQYLQLVKGLEPFTAALWSLPAVVATMVGVGIASSLVAAVRPAYIVAAGLVLAAVGFGVITQVEAGSALWLILTGSAVMSVGVGMVSTLGTDLVVTTAPPERAGAASALSETGNELGGALGIAVLGSIGAAVYRSQMDGLPATDGVPAQVADAAGETLPGAVAVLGSLPGEAGAALLDNAFASFTHGLQAVAATGTVILLLAAVLVGYLLRNVAPKNNGATENDESPVTDQSREADGQLRLVGSETRETLHADR